MPESTARHASRFAPELPVVTWGFLLNLAWEFAQSPLYADGNLDLAYLTRTRLHCTAGDVLILLGSFYIVGLVCGSRRWMARTSWFPPTVAFTALGLVYTVWSEWYQTTVAGGWQYGEAMPVIGGIGLAPLMQWVIVPVLVVLLSRSRMRRAGHVQPAGTSGHDF